MYKGNLQRLEDVINELVDNNSIRKARVKLIVNEETFEMYVSGCAVDLIECNQALVHLNVESSPYARDTIYATYAPSDDKTFVMKDVWDANGDLVSTSCVGWYCGEPNEESTNCFCHGGEDLIARFNE